MRNLMRIGAVLSAIGPFGGTAAAQTCKVDGDAAAVRNAIKSARSCLGAYQMLESCQLGSSADNALADIVLAKCEPLFSRKAVPTVMADYRKARDSCNQIAEDGDGSMAQGFAAICLARTARDFARNYPTKR